MGGTISVSPNSNLNCINAETTAGFVRERLQMVLLERSAVRSPELLEGGDRGTLADFSLDSQTLN